jgi:Vitamin K-dependent gamma-carboxylase
MARMRGFPRALLAVGSPLELAVLRVIVPLLVLRTPEVRDALHHATLAPALRAAPLGFAWAVRLLPPSASSMRLAAAVLLGSALLGAAGLFARAALAVAALSAFYVLGAAQLHGTVTHNHHLVWLLALLAAGPSADVLSLDAARRAYREKPLGTASLALAAEPAPAHALTRLFAWALVAEIYFFPGLWKLREAGLAWVFSDNLRNQMYWKWYETGVIPFLRVDRYPLLCRAGALSAVVFELGFAPLVFFRRTRPFAVGAALCFHALAAVFLRISFPSLWLCYVMFVDWRAVLPRVGRYFFEDGLTLRYREDGGRRHGLICALRTADVLGRIRYEPAPAATPRVATGPAARERSWIPAAALGALLFAGNAWFGAKGIFRSWPLACYPTFQWIAGTSIPRLRVEAVFPDGRAVEVPLPREGDPSRAQKQWGMEWSLAGATDAPDAARLRAHFEEIARRPEVRALVAGVASVRYSRAFYSVIPEAWGEPPRRTVLLAEWKAAPLVKRQ